MTQGPWYSTDHDSYAPRHARNQPIPFSADFDPWDMNDYEYVVDNPFVGEPWPPSSHYQEDFDEDGRRNYWPWIPRAAEARRAPGETLRDAAVPQSGARERESREAIEAAYHQALANWRHFCQRGKERVEQLPKVRARLLANLRRTRSQLLAGSDPPEQQAFHSQQ